MAGLEQYFHSLRLSVVTRTNKRGPIGVGSYASVYEVIAHGTVCAAKELHPILCESEVKRRAFITECVQSSRVLHPNVVQFLGIFYPNPNAQLPWLVMELMHISLTSLIEKYEKTDFPICFKLSILIDTCQGLQFLHDQSIIHRDLSSNNILLTKHLVAKIADLGMAKLIPQGLQRHTQAPGTVAFMPPEALRNIPIYGTPIDVFSVGCVCVHMISMQWPMPLDKIDATNNVILSEIQRRQIYFVNLLRHSSLKVLVEQCLQDKPENRPVIAEVGKRLKIIDRDYHSPENDYSIIELFGSVASHRQRVAEYEKVITQKDELLIEKDKHLNVKDHLIFQKDEQLNELAEKNHHLNEQKQQFRLMFDQKDQQLNLKNQSLVQKDQVILEKDKQLVQRDHLLKLKDNELKQKDIEIKQRDQEISIIKSSHHKKDQQLQGGEKKQKGKQSEQKDQQFELKHLDIKVYKILFSVSNFVAYINCAYKLMVLW